MKPTVIDPKTTSRAEAYDLWMSAPNPMVTFFKTLDVTPLYRLSHRRGLKFNMLLCWCIRAMGQYDGNICYCIEPGVSQQPGDSLTKKGEDFWDNYPAAYNKTISPENIKLLIGRIFQYGYTGPILVSWRLQNDGGDKLANAVATQLLIWETVVGERDADFNKVGTNGKNAIAEQVSAKHPLYSQIMSYYSSIASSVQRHKDLSFVPPAHGGIFLVLQS